MESTQMIDQAKVKGFVRACNIPHRQTKMRVLYGKASEMTPDELKYAAQLHLANLTARIERLRQMNAPTVVIERDEQLLQDGDYVTKLIDKFLAQK